jgi:hypothetical protein
LSSLTAARIDAFWRVRSRAEERRQHARIERGAATASAIDAAGSEPADRLGAGLQHYGRSARR